MKTRKQLGVDAFITAKQIWKNFPVGLANIVMVRWKSREEINDEDVEPDVMNMEMLMESKGKNQKISPVIVKISLWYSAPAKQILN